MSYWKKLEINRTTDRREIKRAYAKALKVIDIDAQPDKFQELRESYEAAINFSDKSPASDLIGSSSAHFECNNNVLPTPPNASVSFDETACPKDQDNDRLSDNTENEVTVFDPYAIADSVMSRVIEVYDSIDLRIDLKNWKDIFDRDELLDLEVRNTLRYWVFEFIAERIGTNGWDKTNTETIGKDVVKYLNGVFDWSNDQLALSQYFPSNQIDAVMYEIHGFKGIARSQMNSGEKIKDPLWKTVIGCLVVVSCIAQLFRAIF